MHFTAGKRHATPGARRFEKMRCVLFVRLCAFADISRFTYEDGRKSPLLSDLLLLSLDICIFTHIISRHTRCRSTRKIAFDAPIVADLVAPRVQGASVLVSLA